MPIQPESAHEILLRVDPGRLRSGWPVGLRDGALLALLAAGLTPREISRLRASDISMDRGKLLVTLHRQGGTWYLAPHAHLGGRLLAWLTERRLWAEGTLVFTAPQGTCLSLKGIHSILHRYRHPRKARRC